MQHSFGNVQLVTTTVARVRNPQERDARWRKNHFPERTGSPLMGGKSPSGLAFSSVPFIWAVVSRRSIAVKV
jgi:hypothetical protein